MKLDKQTLKKYNFVNALGLFLEVSARSIAGVVLVNNFAEELVAKVGYYLIITSVLVLAYVFIKATK